MREFYRYMYITTVNHKFKNTLILRLKVYDMIFTIAFGVFWAPHTISPLLVIRIDGVAAYFGHEFCRIIVS